MKATGERHSFTAADGVELAAYAYGQGAAERAVLVVHGIESHAGWFTASCEALAEAGLRVVCFDRRGSGSSGGPRGHAPSTVLLLDDMRRALGWLRAERPGRPVQVVAHSWGAVYALAYVGRSLRAFERLALIGPGLFPRVDLSWDHKLLAAASALASPELRMAIPIEGPSAFTSTPARQAAIEADESRLREATARFFACAWLLRLRALSAARRTRSPMCVFLAGNDAIIDTEATRRFFYRCREGVVVETFSEAHHTLEFEPDPTAFLEALIGWCTGPPGREAAP